MRASTKLSTSIITKPIVENLTRTLPKKRIEGGCRVIHNASKFARPTLTVATVTLNSKNQLVETVNSVLELHRDDIHYIVIDGGSSDGTIEFLREFGDRLEYWISEPDEGIYDAMNKAVSIAAPNSYILFVGAGDKVRCVPDPVTITAARLAGTEVLYGDVLIGDSLFRSSFSAKLNYRNTLHHQGLFIRKGNQPEPWFNKSLRAFADWDMNLSLFLRRARVESLGYTVAYALPNGVSTKLHLSEIANIIAKRSGWICALAAVSYHSIIYILKLYARFFTGSRE